MNRTFYPICTNSSQTRSQIDFEVSTFNGLSSSFFSFPLLLTLWPFHQEDTAQCHQPGPRMRDGPRNDMGRS